MRIILTTLSASLMAVENDFYVQAVSHRRMEQNTNLLQLDEESAINGRAEWGFLKNIVNIDTFFATGASSQKKSSRLGLNTFM